MQATATTATTDTEALKRDLYAFAYHMLRNANVATFSSIAESDLSFTQIKALCALDAEGDGSSVGALAESLGTSLPAMSRAVDGLFERGLVQREEDPADRRMKRVSLTGDGRRIPDALIEGRLSALQGLIDSLDPAEAASLAATLGPIVDAHEEIAACRPANKGRRT